MATVLNNAELDPVYYHSEDFGHCCSRGIHSLLYKFSIVLRLHVEIRMCHNARIQDFTQMIWLLLRKSSIALLNPSLLPEAQLPRSTYGKIFNSNDSVCIVTNEIRQKHEKRALTTPVLYSKSKIYLMLLGYFVVVVLLVTISIASFLNLSVSQYLFTLNMEDESQLTHIDHSPLFPPPSV